MDMGLAFGVALLLAAAVLITRGVDENSLKAALFITARWSFLFFLLAYAGGALASLSGLRMLARGREYGLSFAAAHLVHLFLVGWLWILLNHAPLPIGGVVFFMGAMGFTYSLALLSFGAWSHVMRSTAGRIFVFIALNYILLAFTSDFFHGALNALGPQGSRRTIIEYFPFAVLCVLAPLLRYLVPQRRAHAMAAE
jgi:hypothetical protein